MRGRFNSTPLLHYHAGGYSRTRTVVLATAHIHICIPLDITYITGFVALADKSDPWHYRAEIPITLAKLFLNLDLSYKVVS